MGLSEKLPSKVLNFIGGKETDSLSKEVFEKLNPHNGKKICDVVRSRSKDVDQAVLAAKKAQESWGNLPGVKRGEVLYEIVDLLKAQKEEIARVVALETGKSLKEALGETGGAIALAQFYAAEGQRLFGRTTTSAVDGRQPILIREPLGVAGLIISANTPIANVAWKVFPALICGNGVVLKSSEDAPITAWIFSKILSESSLPSGVFNLVHGLGNEAGAALVTHPDVAVLSFTGSTAVGKEIAKIAGARLAKLSLELGGKNPMVVCDDADLENAVRWASLSAFSNAGQRCASASRVFVFESVYEKFKKAFVENAESLRVGPTDQDDLGPVINSKAIQKITDAVSGAKSRGAKILCGGERLSDSDYASGYYFPPTVIEGASIDDEISKVELFGPVVCLYPVKDFAQAVQQANHSLYGLTASIHTTSIHRAREFEKKVQAGVVIVNGGTYGSEPHQPFGGVKSSGNGSREPGPEAIEFYSNLKAIYEMTDSKKV